MTKVIKMTIYNDEQLRNMTDEEVKKNNLTADQAEQRRQLITAQQSPKQKAASYPTYAVHSPYVRKGD
jgi:hypothetical protein